MAKTAKHDPAFEIAFYEAVHRRCPDYIEVVELLGGLYTKAGQIAAGLRMDRKLVRLQPENPTAHYNLACSLALSKKRPDALRALTTRSRWATTTAGGWRRTPISRASRVTRSSRSCSAS